MMKAHLTDWALSRMKEVGIVLNQSTEEQLSRDARKPWQEVPTEQVREIIAGTALEPLVSLFEVVTDPALPLEATLPKALVLAGCALTEPRSKEELAGDGAEATRGVARARLRINTAGGQACNIWALVVGPSGCGKDIGNFTDNLALSFDWYIGSAGSAEGLADAYTERGNGFLGVPEFQNWLDKRHWQSGAASFLTAAFNKGWFKVNLSKNNAGPRETDYCYPNVLANVQPEVLAAKATGLTIASGFLPRFLVSYVPGRRWRPRTGDFSNLYERARAALKIYRRKSGVVAVPDKYLDDVCTEFYQHNAPIPAHWRRLVNEYGPRFAVILSVRPDDTSETIVLRDEHWRGAGVLCRWFYAMAERVLLIVEDDEREAKLEKDLRRFHTFIRKKGPVRLSDISHQFSRGTMACYRRWLVDELEERGLVESDEKSRYSVIRTPEEWEGCA